MTVDAGVGVNDGKAVTDAVAVVPEGATMTGMLTGDCPETIVGAGDGTGVMTGVGTADGVTAGGVDGDVVGEGTAVGTGVAVGDGNT